MSEYMVEVKNLCKYFPAGRKRTLKAVDNVSFYIRPGETLGLVGESGCGKTTCGRTLLKLYDQTSGQILFKGQEISHLRGKQLLSVKKNAQMIFQDPLASLNERAKVDYIVSEGLYNVQKDLTEAERRERVAPALTALGLLPEFASRFPHEFSGGQRQRLCIARALEVRPEVLICDEPVSALDVSIQAQVLNLMKKIQKDLGLTYLFIAHDLSVVQYMSNRIVVMYLGKIVEIADSRTLYDEPLHPYTRALLSAIPVPQIRQEKKRIVLPGEVPSPINPPPGCKFAGRCQYATERCRQETPVLRDRGGGHHVACFAVES